MPSGELKSCWQEAVGRDAELAHMVLGTDPCFDVVSYLGFVDPVDGSVAQAQAKSLIAFLLQFVSFQNVKPIQLTHGHHVLHAPFIPQRHAANLVR
eukprot:Skav211354  [mRNA]  locus=scaffold677:81940:88783:+ [translate_table: standard]